MTETSRFKAVGAATLLAAIFVAFMVTAYPENLKAPAGVAYLACALAGLAGAVSIALGFRRPVLAGGLVCLLLTGILAMELWIALGPGPRHCLGRVTTLGANVATSELACRSAFGFGALVVAAMLAIAVRGLLRHRSAS